MDHIILLGGGKRRRRQNERSGEAHWKTPNTDATSSGFTLSGGYRMAFDLNGTMFMRSLGFVLEFHGTTFRTCIITCSMIRAN
jgi:hypothetical protein